MAKQIVAGEIYETITGQLFEIGRQLRQSSGYPFDAQVLKNHLQDAIEGKFPTQFRETGELSIAIPALLRPTLEELQAKYSWIKSIERDTSPTEAVRLTLATVLHPDEEPINGPEYERRLVPNLNLVLGVQHALWLIEHQGEFPELMALLGKIYIDFSGIVVVDVGGLRNIPYFHQDVERWRLLWFWFGGGFDRGGRLAVSGK